MIGDIEDTFRRLRARMPRWFGDSTPVLDAVLYGYAHVASFIYDLINYAGLQTRIKTATDGWLDMIASDFFGTSIKRKTGQTDAQFRNKILINLFRERATRAAVDKVLFDLTGRRPKIFEPQRPQDTGAYGAPNTGYGAAGGYGSLLMPYQAFVTAYRPTTSGIPLVAGYGVSTGAYSTPSRAEYASLSMIEGVVADDDIYQAIASVQPIATVPWAQITS